MTSSNTSSIGGVEASHSGESGVIVHKRLTLAHKNNAGNTCVKVITNVHNLFVDFTCRKRTCETRSTCCTESTAHSTSSLRGSADRELVTIWHTDTFNRGTIRITKQVFTTSVLRNLTNNLLSTSKNYSLRQLFSQCFWEVTHLIKRSSTLRPNPFFNLFYTEFWLTKRSH